MADFTFTPIDDDALYQQGEAIGRKIEEAKARGAPIEERRALQDQLAEITAQQVPEPSPQSGSGEVPQPGAVGTDFTFSPITSDGRSPDELLADPDTVGGLQDFTGAFNDKLAGLAGVPVEAVNSVWTALAGKGYGSYEPGDAKAAVKRGFEAIGINTTAGDTLAAQIGNEAFNNAAMLAILFGGGPALIAGGAASQTALGKGVGAMAETVLAHPGAAITAAAGSSVGAPVGGNMGEATGEQFGPMGAEVGRTVGELSGAMIGGGVTGATGITRGVGRAVGATAGGLVGGAGGMTAGMPIPGALAGGSLGYRWGGNAANRMLTRGTEATLANPDAPTTLMGRMRRNLGLDGTIPDPIIAARDASVARDFAVQAIQGDQIRVDRELSAAITSISRNVSDPTAQGEKLHAAIKLAYDRAQANASKLWGKVDGKIPVTTGRIKNFASSIIKDARSTPVPGTPGQVLDPDALPGDVIKRIQALPDVSNVRDLLLVRRSILNELRAGVDNDTLKRNLVNLDRAIMNAVVKAAPGDKALRSAREYSTWLHDRFSRGPVGDFFGKNRKNSQFLPNPGRDALLMLGKEKAGKQLADVSNINPAIEVEASSMIRSEFNRIAQGIARTEGPAAAHKFLNSTANRRFMRAFPQHYAQYDEATGRLGAALKDQLAVEKSALMKFSAEDPQKAVDDLFTGGNKLKRVHDIKWRLAEDDTGAALQGFQASLIDKLWLVSGNSPKRMQDILGIKDTRAMMQEALGPEKMARLMRAVTSAAKVQNAEAGTGSRVQSFMARFLGAGFAKVAGANTIQGSAAGAGVSDLLYKRLTGLATPQTLFSRAIVDPKWERYLASQIPQNIREMRKSTDAVRQLIFGIQATESVLDFTAMQQGAQE